MDEGWIEDTYKGKFLRVRKNTLRTSLVYVRYALVSAILAYDQKASSRKYLILYSWSTSKRERLICSGGYSKI